MTVFLLMWDSRDPDVGTSIQGIFATEALATFHMENDYTHWQSGGDFYVDEWEVESDIPSGRVGGI